MRTSPSFFFASFSLPVCHGLPVYTPACVGWLGWPSWLLAALCGIGKRRFGPGRSMVPRETLCGIPASQHSPHSYVPAGLPYDVMDICMHI